MSIEFTGRFEFAELRAKVDEAKPAGLTAGMEYIRGVAAPLVPLETGRLVGSAEIEVDGDTVSLSYAGPYARVQHEDLTFKHEHGQAKFEEEALLTGGPTAIKITGETIKGRLR